MDKFIYINENSISSQLCNDIKDLFEEYKEKHNDGTTIGGINKSIKDTSDYVIPFNPDKKWEKISDFLSKELTKNLSKYIKNLNNMINEDENYNMKFNILDAKFLQYDNFMVQKYVKTEGKYIYHNDSFVDFNKNRYRVITYIWYLNDVENGGETIFWDNYKIKPKIGKMVLFPSCWSFPHTGKMPISDNKYIITGWIYINEHKLVVEKVNNILNK